MGKQLVEWSDDFCIGLAEIDRQHAGLVDCLNRLWDATLRYASTPELLACVDELERYTHYHFREEEEGMRRSAYPQREVHCIAHQRFAARIAAERVNVLCDGYVTLDLLRFLHHWLLNHINAEDRDYAEHVRRNARPVSLLSRMFRSTVGDGGDFA